MSFARLKKEDAETHRQIIVRAAQMCDLMECQAGLVLTCLFDEMARQIADGKVVVIPGFGAFMACTFDIPTKTKGKTVERTTVKFVLARPMKRLLTNMEKEERYRRNVEVWRSRRRNISSSTFRVKDMIKSIETPVMEPLRQAYEARSRRYGIPLPVKDLDEIERQRKRTTRVFERSK